MVGGSKATIYAWFGGKEGLFEAVVRQKCHDVVLAIHVDTGGSLEAAAHRDRPVVPRDGAVAADPRISPADGVDRPDLSGDRPAVSSRPGRSPPTASWRRGSRSSRRTAASIDEDPYRLAVLFLDMLIGEHQLSWLTGMPRAARRDKIDETVRLAVKVFLRGCAAPAEAAAARR